MTNSIETTDETVLLVDAHALATVTKQLDDEGIEIMLKCSMCGSVWETNLHLPLEMPVLKCANGCIDRDKASRPEDFHADGTWRVRL